MKSKLIQLLVAALLCSLPGWAGPIFVSSLLSGSPGQTLTFEGTVLDDWGYDAFLNGVTINLAAPFAPGDYDSSPFLSNPVLTAILDGQSLGPFDWFTVAIPLGLPAGTYDGDFSILGGPTQDDQNILGNAAGFQVRVDTRAPDVPEPASLWLTGGAILALIARTRRRSLERHS